MRFQDRVVLVTGGGSGIGRATALRFAGEGAALVLADVELEGLQAVAREIQDGGGKVGVVQGNVAERADAERMVQSALDAFGRLDVVINNAGVTRDGLAVRVKDGQVKMMTEAQWDTVLDINLKGTFLVAQAA